MRMKCLGSPTFPVAFLNAIAWFYDNIHLAEINIESVIIFNLITLSYEKGIPILRHH